MADKERSSKAGTNNSQSQGGSTRTPASSTQTGGNQSNTTPGPSGSGVGKGKGKGKKKQDGGAGTGMTASGAQIVNDPAGSSGQGQASKGKKGSNAQDMVLRRPPGQNNTMEYRFDYVVSDREGIGGLFYERRMKYWFGA